MNNNQERGMEAEEALRRYFLSLGYYVLRGVPFKYKGFDITDIDLLIYNRSSLITRERINVDIKRKKTPQAIERIFWTKGLQNALGFEKCIVATTDSRQETADFGETNNVIVLGGELLKNVIIHFKSEEDRLIEEDFIVRLNESELMAKDVSIQLIYESNKENLLTQLNYNGCNTLLSDIEKLLHEYIVAAKEDTTILRVIYILISYFLISLDYVSRTTAHFDVENRQKVIVDGLRYGDAGKERINEIIQTAAQLIPTYSKELSAQDIQREAARQLQSFPVTV